MQKNNTVTLRAHIYAPRDTTVNIFEYVTAHPMSYYNDGNLYFYQDIWKHRGLRSVYMKTKSIGNAVRQYISGSILKVYGHHIHICWSLTKGYIYARPQRYMRLLKRTFIGKRKAKGTMRYRGKGLRGKAPLFGVSMIGWLAKFAVSARLHKSRGFSHVTPAMWKITWSAVRGQYNKFVRRSYLYLKSGYAQTHRTIKYGIFAVALLYHIIHNSSVWHATWLQRHITRKKRARGAHAAGVTPLDKRSTIARRIKKVLLGSVKKPLRVKKTLREQNNKVIQSNRIKLYHFPTPLNLYASMDYMRTSGTRFNKRMATNTLYTSTGNNTRSIHVPKVNSLLVHLRRKIKAAKARQARQAAKARQARRIAKMKKSNKFKRNIITSQVKQVQKCVYNIKSSQNNITGKVNHATTKVAYNTRDNS